MNGIPLNGDVPHSFCKQIKIEGFEISCAAPYPFGPGFSFGSDDGRVKFTDEAGSELFEMHGQASSGEATSMVSPVLGGQLQVCLPGRRSWCGLGCLKT